MKNYKSDFYHPKNFEKTEIETQIPTYLVNEIQNMLDKMVEHVVTPAIIDPKDMSVVFGIMDMSDRTMKYKVSITAN